jgi:phage tail sheath gpL-like
MGYFDVDRIGQVSIGRAVTTYTVADNGTIDLSLRDINIPALLACMSRRIRTRITSKYTGWAFRADGIVGRNSSKVLTLAALDNFIIGLAQEFSDDNWVQDIEGFIQSLETSVDPETGCISIRINPTLVKQVCCFNVTIRSN